MKYSKYFGTKRHGFIKSKSVLAPKGPIHLLNENIRYDNTIGSWKAESNIRLIMNELMSIFVNDFQVIYTNILTLQRHTRGPMLQNFLWP
jgi:hypothetical protein